MGKEATVPDRQGVFGVDAIWGEEASTHSLIEDAVGIHSLTALV